MSLKIDKSVKNFLLDFGLTEKEITVYTTLLKTGPNTIMNLARETGIKRSTTHNTVEELIKKGLVSQTNYGERRMVIAEDPDKLKFLMEQKKWDINKLEKNLPDTIEAIYSNIPRARENSDVEVKYYKGKKEVFYLYELSFKSENVYSFVNLDKFYDVFPNTEDMFWKALNNIDNRKVYDIAVDSPLAKELSTKHPRYYCKFIESNNAFGGVDILIFDNKVGIVHLDRENPTATLLSSKDLADSFKSLHSLVWMLLSN